MSAFTTIPIKMGRFVANLARSGISQLRDREYEKHRSAVEKILHSSDPFDTRDSERRFSELQNDIPPVSEYGYDELSAWRRAVKRVDSIVQIEGMSKPGAKLLETSCGDGMTGFLLECYGHEIQSHDLSDWREPRARHLPMVTGDLRPQLALDSGRFDFACSFNAFEHVTDPREALAEMIRLVRPGGWILLEFGPLFPSAWGLHAYRSLRMPFPQFLFSEKFAKKKLKEVGIWDLGAERDELQPLNRWRLNEFDKLWREVDCELIENKHFRIDHSALTVIPQFPQAFTGRNLTWDDVTVEGIRVLLRKR